MATWTTAQLLARTAASRERQCQCAARLRQSDYSDDRPHEHRRKRVRVKLANAFGSAPVTIGAAHIALRKKDSTIVRVGPRSGVQRQAGSTIGPGVVLLSDPVDLNLPALADVAVSLYFPGETGPPTTHATALHTTYISKEGDMTGHESIADATTTQSYYWLYALEVMAPAKTA